MIIRKQLLSFWPDVLGIGALFLPFVIHYSPARALIDFEGYSLLAAAAFLSIPIAVWQGLRVRRKVTMVTEQVIAYTLSIGAMLPPIVFAPSLVGYLLRENSSSNTNDLFFLAALGASGILIIGNTLLLWQNLRKAASADVTIGVFLTCSYLPNAAFSMLVYFPETLFTRLDFGAYVVLAACIGYSLRIVDLMRHGAKAYRPEESSD